jgi:hypothetical protein
LITASQNGGPFRPVTRTYAFAEIQHAASATSAARLALTPGVTYVFGVSVAGDVPFNGDSFGGCHGLVLITTE